mmetsp:Transcript_103685/g.251744  ORF Transcript_103685/g.251744 Transcript_103685/m.251744 type:complete len:232 (+) Transcript_103685:227-922(+)
MRLGRAMRHRARNPRRATSKHMARQCAWALWQSSKTASALCCRTTDLPCHAARDSLTCCACGAPTRRRLRRARSHTHCAGNSCTALRMKFPTPRKIGRAKRCRIARRRRLRRIGPSPGSRKGSRISTRASRFCPWRRAKSSRRRRKSSNRRPRKTRRRFRLSRRISKKRKRRKRMQRRLPRRRKICVRSRAWERQSGAKSTRSCTKMSCSRTQRRGRRTTLSRAAQLCHVA